MRPREVLAADLFRRASESIEVSSVPLEEIVGAARAERVRRRRRALVGVAVAALVVGVATWLSTRSSSEPDSLGPLEVRRAPNPVDVAWYAGGRLHLDDVTVALPALTDLVELNGGAVYGDHEGTVAFVAADGERRLLGHKDPDTLLVGSTAQAWVAWIEPGEDRRLVAYDVSTGEVVDTRDLPAGDAQLIALDQHRIFYRDSAGAYAWTPGVDSAERLVRGGLVDVESATRVYQEGRRIDMVQAFFSVDFERPGIGALLSPGGTHVLTRRPDGAATRVGAPYRPLLYDARSGDALDTGVGRGERAVDATFGDNLETVYLVAQVADLAGGSDLDGNIDPLLVLRSCSIGGQCHDVAPVQTGTDRPLLAH